MSQTDEVPMPLPLDLEFAKQRLREAQGALEAYLIFEQKDIVRHKRLAEALRAAIDDYLSRLIDCSPSI